MQEITHRMTPLALVKWLLALSVSVLFVGQNLYNFCAGFSDWSGQITESKRRFAQFCVQYDFVQENAESSCARLRTLIHGSAWWRGFHYMSEHFSLCMVRPCGELAAELFGVGYYGALGLLPFVLVGAVAVPLACYVMHWLSRLPSPTLVANRRRWDAYALADAESANADAIGYDDDRDGYGGGGGGGRRRPYLSEAGAQANPVYVLLGDPNAAKKRISAGAGAAPLVTDDYR